MSTGSAALLNDARAARAHELMVEQLCALTTSEQWLAMLEMGRQFHTYSARNALLLLAQGAQGRVAGYRTWQAIPARSGGTCQVRKGAQALTVLAPITRDREAVDEASGERTVRRVLIGFKPVRVFDEAALVEPPAATEVMPDLLRGEAPTRLFTALADQIRGKGFQVQDGDCAPANGRTDWMTRMVTIRPDLEPAQRTKTLAHELAHVHLHDPSTEVARRASRDRIEVEAESVAYLVCAHAGIDSASYTIPYVAHWSGGQVDLVQATAERVIDTARRITDGLDAALHPEPDVAPELCPEPTASPSVLPPAARAAHPSMAAASPSHDLDFVRRSVERDAARLLARLAANPEAWGADPESLAAVRRAAAAANPPATAGVATARERLADLIHHPAAPEPPDLAQAATLE